ncbi:hypothetical protein R1sor_025774 [Riccia sorocarpa]|uniref:Uncharacterized protein n=1 Tax=Riccia sorocarpa TaxID=122646 RepID=A0ABD3GB22_9MARC
MESAFLEYDFNAEHSRKVNVHFQSGRQILQQMLDRCKVSRTRIQSDTQSAGDAHLASSSLASSLMELQLSLTNLAYLNTSLPHTVSTDAIGLLANEAAEANRFMGECLEQDKFKRISSARKAHTSLESLRQKLVSCFQPAFVITSLDVLATVEQLHNDLLHPRSTSSGANHDDSLSSSEAGREASTGPSLSLWLAESPKSSSSPRTEIVSAGEPTFSSQSNVVACVGDDSSTQRDLEVGTGASLGSRLDHDNEDDCLLAIFAFIGRSLLATFAFIGRSLGIICLGLGFIFLLLVISAVLPVWCIYGVCTSQTTIGEFWDLGLASIRNVLMSTKAGEMERSGAGRGA